MNEWEGTRYIVVAREEGGQTFYRCARHAPVGVSMAMSPSYNPNQGKTACEVCSFLSLISTYFKEDLWKKEKLVQDRFDHVPMPL